MITLLAIIILAVLAGVSLVLAPELAADVARVRRVLRGLVRRLVVPPGQVAASARRTPREARKSSPAAGGAPGLAGPGAVPPHPVYGELRDTPPEGITVSLAASPGHAMCVGGTTGARPCEDLELLGRVHGALTKRGWHPYRDPAPTLTDMPAVRDVPAFRIGPGYLDYEARNGGARP
jgi:hypothetical protein